MSETLPLLSTRPHDTILSSEDLLDPTMRSSPGAALGHNQVVVMVPSVEKMMMFK